MSPLYWRATTLSEVTGIILPSGWSPVPPLPLKETDYSRPPPGGHPSVWGRPESAVDMAPAVILAISPSTVVPSLPEAPEAARASAAATRSAAGL